jgi:hypothetical protein
MGREAWYGVRNLGSSDPSRMGIVAVSGLRDQVGRPTAIPTSTIGIRGAAPASARRDRRTYGCVTLAGTRPSTTRTTHIVSSWTHFLHAWADVSAGSSRMRTEGACSLEGSIEIFLSMPFLQLKAATAKENAWE